MIGLIQRVKQAWVDIENQRVGAIDVGIMALIGVERDDEPQHASIYACRGYRKRQQAGLQPWRIT